MALSSVSGRLRPTSAKGADLAPPSKESFPKIWAARPAALVLRASRVKQRGFSLIELLIVIAIILIILSIALPQMGKARMHAQEMAALKTVNTVNTTQVQYYSQFGKYAASLAQLGPPTGAGVQEGPDAAGLIPASLAAGTSSGYQFTLSATPTGYSVIAVPKTFGSTGRRTFYSDQSGVTRENWGQDPPSATSPEVK